MTTNQEKILNYLLFFLLALTGLSSLLLVKNNYLYIFILIFLLLYWQRFRVPYPPSFPLFLTLGLVGVLLFQVFSGSPRFHQRPILTLIVSLVFYLPYFFLWYRIFLIRKNVVLKAFFLSGFGGIVIFGLIFGRLTTTIVTAPSLASGLLYVLLKAAGILSVIGALTAFPFLFFPERETTPLVKEEETKNDSGFGLIEILVGVSLFLVALTVVGAARHRQDIAEQKLEQIEKNRLEKIAKLKPKAAERVERGPIETPKADKDQVEKVEKGEEQPRPQTSEEKGKKQSAPSSQDAEDFYPYDVADPASCQANPSIPGCEAYYYDPYSDPNSPEYQQQLMEQWYYSQPSSEELFFNDPMELWNKNPFMYETLQDIYNFDPIPGFP